MRKLILILALLICLTGCSLSALREHTPTPQVIPTLDVTPDDLARAMQGDSFFSEYGSAILHVQGIVASVTRAANNAQITLKTSLSTKVICVTTGDTRQIQAGDPITIQSSQGARGTDAVILNNCTVLSQNN